ncbi:isocitrate dehydrogenase (NAD(+)) [Turicibacter bilis]|uniref:isocitrate dehydrogenase (NAD(+)) n=1 Tax=Turicibacter bilis TaxID=2735723 RepID=UPI001BAF5FA7|nr:isocitrate dehydrogenase (NAD(+)) [Turicibacter bilis]MBS3202484.1 isocitrate dehydrogenase (NAD(+)) [Turicibacter bilis]MDY4815475.1 isocitrate dehydrogenase (NAD(+)) [Turicibacter bilis]UUF10393.1 isocitrate dehydrogenase (NAD(+)) [Turicibacter bilis]
MRTVTLIPGDGIGPEISQSVVKIFEAAKVPIKFEIVEAGAKVMDQEKTPLPQAVLDSIQKNKVALKGPITTPIGSGFRSVNVALRQYFDLYANVRPVKSIKGVPSRYEEVDLIIVRENTEDLYAGIEHKIGEVAAESIKVITKKASDRIAKYAFTLANQQQREKVTAVHKANIMKLSDGLFLDCVRDIRKQYPDIEYDEQIVDAMCMNLVLHPESSDVLVMGNLYGDILSDLCAGFVGGLGLIPGANIGEEIAIFEAVHGSAPSIAGCNQANPTALIQSAIMMLRHLNLLNEANRIEAALYAVYEEGQDLTKDLGGTATTTQFTDALIAKLLNH